MPCGVTFSPVVIVQVELRPETIVLSPGSGPTSIKILHCMPAVDSQVNWVCSQ